MDNALERQLDETIGLTTQGMLPSNTITVDAVFVKLIHASDSRVLCPGFKVAKHKKIDVLVRTNLWHKVHGTTIALDDNMLGGKLV